MAEDRLRIVNWNEFQHYKDRTPPWIKLHRSLLENQEWNALPDSAARLLPELWLIASESEGGTVRCDSEWLAWRLRRASGPKIAKDLQTLEAYGFIELPDGGGYQDASTALADRYRDASAEGEGEEREKEDTPSEGSSLRSSPSPGERQLQRSVDNPDTAAQTQQLVETTADALGTPHDQRGPDPPEEPEGWSFGDLMGLVREVACTNGAEPNDSDGSILKQWRSKYSDQDIADAIRGHRSMIEDGAHRFIEPGEHFHLKALHRETKGRHPFTAAVEYHRYRATAS